MQHGANHVTRLLPEAEDRKRIIAAARQLNAHARRQLMQADLAFSASHLLQATRHSPSPVPAHDPNNRLDPSAWNAAEVIVLNDPAQPVADAKC